jgi:cytochrome bd ubiquinol oxidase subunit I
MHYPWWYVPHLTAPMLIAVISVLHVLVSHYAVGGGLFLAVEVGHAYRTGNRQYLDYLHGHARFFILLTVVFGAITGVGIWWTIGLSSPLSTEVLIRTFVFGWATEWVFFVVELISAFIFLYYWDRLAEKTHLAIGWIYAGAAWISLVLITGITAFMLNSGHWAIDPESRSFWTAFFNPQFLPQTIARTGGALLLSSLYVYLHASLSLRSDAIRNMIALRSARPAMLGVVLVVVGGVAWYCLLPDAAAATLMSAAPLNILTALILALSGVIVVLLYVGPYRNPGWLSPGFAASLCLFGIAAFATGEFIREAVRKPYIVHNVVLANQLLPEEVARMRGPGGTGYLEGGVWTKAYMKAHYLQTTGSRPPMQEEVEAGIRGSERYGGPIQGRELLKLPYKDRLTVGRTLFLYHCNDCHAEQIGYSAVGPLLQGRPRSKVIERVKHLDENYYMPPWCGNDAEAELLTDYLMKINPPPPASQRPWVKQGGSSDDGAAGGMP